MVYNTMFNLAAAGIRSDTALLNATTAKESGLTAALVVFVILTLLLITFIVLLFAVKPFRAFFFKPDDEKKTKTAKKRPEKKSRSTSSQTRNKRQRSNESTVKRQSSYDDDGVPTVPLNSVTTTVAPVKSSGRAAYSGNTLDKIPTIVLGQTEEQHAAHETAVTKSVPHAVDRQKRAVQSGSARQTAVKPAPKNANPIKGPVSARRSSDRVPTATSQSAKTNERSSARTAANRTTKK